MAPALAQLDVPLVATHFFVFYYGVLADVTSPVALAAFAAVGIARSEPMRTGMTAFRLSMGKAVVPFMFVYAPSLLFLNFSWQEFVVSLSGAVLAIVALGTANTGYFTRPLPRWAFALLNLAALLMIFSNLKATLLGAVLTLGTLAWLAYGKPTPAR